MARSRQRNVFFYLSFGILAVLLISFYYMMRTISQETKDTLIGKQSKVLEDVQARIDAINAKLIDNEKLIGELRNIGLKNGLQNANNGRLLKSDDVIPAVVDADSCKISNSNPKKPDIQMNKAVDEIPFDNPDGGAWKQGWDITYKDSDFTAERPLRVFVIPHSHCDPGWLKTFQQYYDDQVRGILSNARDILPEDEDRRFIYAEMSFFSKFWYSEDDSTRQKMKKLMQSGQLEVVTGGWVMPDEANSHYFALVDQLIEGHEFMQGELGTKPESGWAIDPFGHSPTMAYILKRAGFKHMLIQRIHYSIKKYLARTRQLEFKWMQTWDTTGSTAMKCHMMPFYSYDVPHTCGPDPSVCCQFDFARLPGSKYSCPWHKPSRPITNENVQSRAETLLDQYRKKSQLYKTNVVLIPLGDDFRYDSATEFKNQMNNYEKIFKFINSKKELNAQVQWGTLSEYFNALEQELGTGRTPLGLPTLSGDFYTYADRDDHYWSGYFTSRPFYKRMDRVLESHLRSGEIVFSFARTLAKKLGLQKFDSNMLMEKLVLARRALGLFQHHDGITGTAKTPVNDDYGKRMIDALAAAKQVMETSSVLLLSQNKQDISSSSTGLRMLRHWEEQSGEASFDPVDLTDGPADVLLYNSLGWTRSELVTIKVEAKSAVEVQDPSGKVLETQLNPVWERDRNEASSTYLFVSFIAELPALGFARFTLQTGSKSSLVSYASIFDGRSSSEVPKHFTLKNAGAQDMVLENKFLKLNLHKTTGLLQSTELKSSGKSVKTELQFIYYGVGRGKGGERSGAYLFFPDGEAKPVIDPTSFVLEKGPVFDLLYVHVSSQVKHKVVLPKGEGVSSHAPIICNVVDLTQTDYELGMRITTDIKNENREFFSDLNGFQLLRRRTLDKVPKQANFYPMPSQAGLEDTAVRCSLLSGQSLGVASLNQGQFEVILDRRLTHDDNRGLGQGVMDNKLTPNVFRLLVEAVNSPRRSSIYQQPTSFASSRAHHLSLSLIQPVYEFSVEARDLAGSLTLLAQPLPCDLHLLNLRTRQQFKDRSLLSDETALILHRLGVDCRFSTQCGASSPPVLRTMFNQAEVTKAEKTSLTMLKRIGEVDVGKPVSLPSMEIETYVVKLK